MNNSPKHNKNAVAVDTESALVSLEKKNSYLLDKACKLLQISPESRTQEEINLLIKAFENNKYFKNNYSDNFTYEDFIKMCTNHLKYEYFPQGSIICHYGEIGTKFYIILKGSIDCFILKTEEEINHDIVELTKPKEIAELLSQNESLQNDLRIVKSKLLNYNQNVTEIIKLKKANTMIFQNSLLEFFKDIHTISPKYYDEVQPLKNLNENNEMYFYQGFCRFKKIRSMYTGDFFGEIALTLSKPRIATITARENLHLASLNKEDYNKIFENQIAEMNQKMHCFLSQFNSFSRDAIIKFTYEFKPINFNSHQVIFKQGDNSSFVYLVKSGCVKLLKLIENNNKNASYDLDYNPNLVRPKKRDEKKQILIALISQNEFFGEDDVIKKTKRSYSAVATQYTEMYYITAEVLNIIKKNQKEFYHIIREKAALKEKWKRERLLNLEQSPVKIKGTNKKRDLSLGLRALESINPVVKTRRMSNSKTSENFKVETIRGSSQIKSQTRGKEQKMIESFQIQTDSVKYKKLTMELINHIVKKNSKILKLNLNNHIQNDKNSLFEYFRSNKYQENYVRARLSNKRNSNKNEIGLLQKTQNLYLSTQTLEILKKLKTKSNTNTEESLEKEKETEAEQKFFEENKIKKHEKIKLCYNPNTINPYQLSSSQVQNNSEKEIEPCNNPTSTINAITNYGTPLISSKHNMFRVKPKKFYIMKNFYKL